MQNEISTDIIIKVLAGSCTDKEKAEVISWYNKSETNKKIFEEYKETWHLTGNIPDDFSVDTNKAWESVSSRIENYESVKNSNNKNHLMFFAKVAAVFVVGLVLYFLYSININSQLTFVKVASVGSKVEVVLPDGSKVWLNKNTSLEYVKDFIGDTRLVKLDGEAFFEVTHNSTKPFIIESEYSQVQVIGTSFDYAVNDSLNKLIVESGIVEFSDSNNENVLRLSKGEKAILSVKDNLIVKSKIINKNYLAWKTGVLSFNNTSFEVVIETISKYYSTEFTYTSPNPNPEKLTVTFDNQDLDDVLKILEITMDVTFQKTADQIIIN